jgi:hypothetical protein
MKFRYAGNVQRSLIEHEALLDVSLQLTRINHEIKEMQQVDTGRRLGDPVQLKRMMYEQAFDNARSSRWISYLDAALASPE